MKVLHNAINKNQRKWIKRALFQNQHKISFTTKNFSESARIEAIVFSYTIDILNNHSVCQNSKQFKIARFRLVCSWTKYQKEGEMKCVQPKRQTEKTS